MFYKIAYQQSRVCLYSFEREKHFNCCPLTFSYLFIYFPQYFIRSTFRIFIQPPAICTYCARMLVVKCSIKEFPLLTLWVIMSPGSQYNFIPWLIWARLSHHFTSTFQFSCTIRALVCIWHVSSSIRVWVVWHACNSKWFKFFALNSGGLIGLLHTFLE